MQEYLIPLIALIDISCHPWGSRGCGIRLVCHMLMIIMVLVLRSWRLSNRTKNCTICDNWLNKASEIAMMGYTLTDSYWDGGDRPHEG